VKRENKNKSTKKVKKEVGEVNEEKEATVEVRCLDNGQTYRIEATDPIGVINTDGIARLKVPSAYAEATVPTYGVEAKNPNKDEKEAEKKSQEYSRRSSKGRMGQRLKENVGLLGITKDVGFIAARQRVKVHLERVGKIEELVKQRDIAIRAVLEKEAELCIRIEEMAAASPLELAANAFTQEYDRRRRKLETSLLRQHIDTVSDMCQRWRETLIRIEGEVARDQEASRVQLDHYAHKAEVLRKAKQRRDLQQLEKQTVMAAKAKAGQAAPQVAAISKKADEKYLRNEAKYKAAQSDFEATTQSAIRAYDTAVIDRWHDLAPLFSELLSFDTSLSDLVSIEAMPLRQTAENTVANSPPVLPLASRVVAARAGTLEKGIAVVKSNRQDQQEELQQNISVSQPEHFPTASVQSDNEIATHTDIPDSDSDDYDDEVQEYDENANIDDNFYEGEVDNTGGYTPPSSVMSAIDL